MPIVEMPDGTVVEMPETLTLGQQAQLAEIAKRGQGHPSPIGEPGKVVDSAIYGAITGIPRLVKAGGDWLESKIPTPEWSKIPIPFGEQIGKLDDETLAALKPTSREGQMTARVGEAALGALLSPAGITSPIKSAIVGGSAGLGAEAGSALTGGNPLGTIAGGLLGGGTAGLVSAAKTNRSALAKEAIEGLSAKDIDKAMERMLFAEKHGIPINISQAMDKPSNLDAYVEALSSSKHGRMVQDQLNSQPGAIAARGKKLLSDLPGEHLPARIMANEAQEAATAAIAAVKEKAKKAWQKFAPIEAEFKPGSMQEFDDKLAAMVKDQPQTASVDLVNEVRKAIRKPVSEAVEAQPGIVDATGKPFKTAAPETLYWNNVLDAKEAIDDVLGHYGSRMLNTPTLTGKELRQAQQVRLAFRSMVEKEAPELAKANAAFSSVMDDANAMQKSVTGAVAGQRGARPTANAPQGTLMSVFDKGTVPGGKSEILTLEKDLRTSGNPEAFLNAGKTWIAERLTKGIAAETASSRSPDQVAGNLLKAFGDPRSLGTPHASASAQGFNDVLAGMARSQGVEDVPQYVKGFKDFMKIVTDASRRPSGGQGPSTGEIKALAQSGLTRNIGQVSLMTPLRQPALAWARWLEQDALKAVDKLLTTPEGVRSLVSLAKSQPNSQTRQVALQTLFGLVPRAGQEAPSTVDQ